MSCSILAIELYRIIYGFNSLAIIKVIIGKILELAILLILYIDSKFL